MTTTEHTEAVSGPRPVSSPDSSGFWGSYAVGLVADLRFGPPIVEYLRAIEPTLEPFGGRFLVHGGAWEHVEGEQVGAPVIIGFPDATGAARWYKSEAYQQIAHLRIDNSHSRVLLAEGVDVSHRSTDIEGMLADL